MTKYRLEVSTGFWLMLVSLGSAYCPPPIELLETLKNDMIWDSMFVTVRRAMLEIAQERSGSLLRLHLEEYEDTIAALRVFDNLYPGAVEETMTRYDLICDAERPVQLKALREDMKIRIRLVRK